MFPMKTLQLMNNYWHLEINARFQGCKLNRFLTEFEFMRYLQVRVLVRSFDSKPFH